jgi:hypothetical protein
MSGGDPHPMRVSPKMHKSPKKWEVREFTNARLTPIKKADLLAQARGDH